MSNDPNYPNYPPNYPGFGPPGYPPPPPGYPGSDPAAIRQKAMLPGVFLIVMGFLSILAALYFLLTAMTARNDPRVLEQVEEILAKQHQDLKMTPEEFLNTIVTTLNMLGAVGFLCGLIVLLGGIAMVTLRMYGLAVFASVLACVPCMTAMGCCGFGQGIGIWALIVLFNAEVKAAFK